ncbi:MAG: ParB/RepB/Spo0J family partition protein [bacterium]
MPQTKDSSVLGKGLSALISSNDVNLSSKGYIPNLPIEQLSPNPQQPRMSIKPEDLIDIADSIRESGVIQPLIVTKRADKDYVLIAGERRMRAAQLAGLKHIPVVVREASPQQMLELAVIENVQRKDLNPIEEALAFSQLKEKFNLSHDEIGKKVGLNRVTVVNKIRLLNLPDHLKQLVLDEKLSEGHVRALLGIPDDDSMIAAADVVMRKRLSVHATEDLVRRIVQDNKLVSGRPRRLSPRALQIEDILKKIFPNTAIEIRKLKGGGKITIRYKGNEGLEEVFKKLKK